MVLGIARLLCPGFALEVDGDDPAGDSVASRRLSAPAAGRRRLRPTLAATDNGGSGKAPLFLAQPGCRLHCIGCSRPYHTRHLRTGGLNPLERRRDGRGEPNRPCRDLCECAFVLPLEDGGAAPSVPGLSPASSRRL